MNPPSPPSPQPFIQMNEVSVGSMREPDNLLVEQVDWTVHPGDYWVIAGLQGAGKSDFLMTTAGLMAPRRGRYELFGEAMPIFEGTRLKERLRLGLVFDNGQLFNHLTVRENVALPLRYHQNLTGAEAERAVNPILEALELEPWAACTPGLLGRNWQKRAGLARALALQPELLLLDNPLGGLDLRHLHWWLRCLRQLSEGHTLLLNRPLTLVVTAADLRPWKDHARQFGILRNRRLLVLGSWSQVEAANAELVHELVTSGPR